MLCFVSDMNKADLRQAVHKCCLDTSCDMWPMIQRWIENLVITGDMLLERYQRKGSWVVGLFLWLTAVVSHT